MITELQRGPPQTKHGAWSRDAESVEKELMQSKIEDHLKLNKATKARSY